MLGRDVAIYSTWPRSAGRTWGEDMATTETTDAKLLKMVKDSGHGFGPAILATSKREKLSFALALVEQESGFRNIFGCDKGAPFCHLPVTPDRVKALIAHVNAGGISNGVGLTQLTSLGFIQQAEAHGGAHKVRPQWRVGFGLLHGLIEKHGEEFGMGAYNGGEGNPNFDYAAQLMKRRDNWQARINQVLLG